VRNEPQRWWSGVLLVLALAATTIACGADARTTAPQHLKLATGWTGTVWDIVGEALADEYRRHLPGLTIATEPVAGLYDKVDALERGTLDLAFVDAETAYRAYKGGASANVAVHSDLRAIAVLFPTVVQIVARKEAHVATPGDLRGKRVAAGPKGGYADQALQLVLESYGIERRAVRILYSSTPERDAVLAEDSSIDAQVYWAPLHQPSITRVVHSVPSTLVPLDYREIGELQNRNHFLKSTIIAAHSYPNQDRDVLSVGQDVLLLCREGLPDDLVSQLTGALFDAVPQMRRIHAAAGAIDPVRGPTTSIPLHSGAARYYRLRELFK
jgi:uncharacterized protein